MNGTNLELRAQEVVLSRIRHRLAGPRKRPKMYFTCREALLAHVWALLDLASSGLDLERSRVRVGAVEFWKKHLETDGNRFVGLHSEYPEEWAAKVFADADEILNAIEQEYR